MVNKIEQTKEQLKKEFFGIDEQIDQVVKAFETWLLVKDYQIRPMIVCLWGLTGTGKTALINRTIELLDLNKKKFYVKFGAKTSNIDDDFEQNSCEDTAFILDEFQYFKTKKEDGDEIERDENNSTNVIWELLDGGIINLYGQNSSYGYEKFQIASTIHALKTLDEEDATLNNGIISHSDLESILKKLYIPLDKKQSIDEEKYGKIDSDNLSNYYKYDDDDDDDDYPIVEKEMNDDDEIQEKGRIEYSKTEKTLRNLMQVGWSSLFDFIRKREVEIKFYNRSEFYNFLKNQTSIPDLIKLLVEVRDAKPKLEVRNYTKSIIFVIGNLDECYAMSRDLNSDLDADYFYRKTKNITIIDIRRALLSRFRSEQIARLGSTHIIYPSLSKKAFNQIIDKELDNFGNIIIKKLEESNNKIEKVEFSDSIKKLIYKEGVFPTIGARSVFSTVNDIVVEKFVYIINFMLSLKSKGKNIKIIFDYKNSNIIIKIYVNNKLAETKLFKYLVRVDKLRIEKNKGKQTHRAVHEAGHTVCSIVLEHIFPEVVYSVVLNNKDGGFNLMNSDEYYYHRKNNYIYNVATSLGGYAAEQIIFGDENLSNGSGSDIKDATSLLSTLYKDTGFKTIGKFYSPSFTSTFMDDTVYSIVDKNDQLDDRIIEDLKTAHNLAYETLIKEKELFLKVSEYLSKNPKLSSKKIKELTKKHIKTKKYEDLLKNKEDFYLDKLNEHLNK